MCSRPFRPVGLPIYVARPPRLHSLVATLATLPSISEISFFDCSFAIISSKIGCRMDSVQFARVLVWLNHFVIATELVTTRAMPDRDVFYVAHPIRSIVSRLLPQRSTATSRLYRPCRSSRSLHSSETRLSARPAGRGDKARPCTSRTPLRGMGGVTPQIKVGYRCD